MGFLSKLSKSIESGFFPYFLSVKRYCPKSKNRRCFVSGVFVQVIIVDKFNAAQKLNSLL